MTQDAGSIKKLITASGLGLHDGLGSRTDLYLEDASIETLVSSMMIGIQVGGMPPRTRSKFIKGKLCETFGYPTPIAFKRVRPPFTGQNLDVYTQKGRNLQIWNDGIPNDRRYLILSVNANDQIDNYRLIYGDELQKLDSTGTKTTKFQASFPDDAKSLELV